MLILVIIQYQHLSLLHTFINRYHYSIHITLSVVVWWGTQTKIDANKKALKYQIFVPKYTEIVCYRIVGSSTIKYTGYRPCNNTVYLLLLAKKSKS